MAKKPEPPKLFWLSYHHPEGRAAGVVVIESHGLLHARLMASVAGADRELDAQRGYAEFASGHQLEPESARQVPANMMGRLLDDGDLRKLHQVLLKEKPPAPIDATSDVPRRGRRPQTVGQAHHRAARGTCELPVVNVTSPLRRALFGGRMRTAARPAISSILISF
jgi:hypothetical protein